MFDTVYNCKVSSLLKEEISSAVYRYNDPELVWRFQKFCGIQKVDKEHENQKNYVINNKYLFYLFQYCSLFGEEIFSIIYFTILFNIFDPCIARQVVFYWTLTMYVGEAIKDFFQMERPKYPPVIRLESKFSLQYGMPSTHAIGAVAHSLGLIFHQRWKYDMTISIILASTWVILISLSRLYKGVHSIADILVGVCITLFQMAIIYPFIDKIDYYIISSWTGTMIFFVFLLRLIYIYPDPPTWNSSRSESFIFLGSLFGIMLGSRIDYWLLSSETFEYYEVSLLTKLLRFCIIMFVIYLIKLIFKPIIYYVISAILERPVDTEEQCREKVIESFYYPIMYCIIGLAISILVPRFYLVLGLGRLYPY